MRGEARWMRTNSGRRLWGRMRALSLAVSLFGCSSEGARPMPEMSSPTPNAGADAPPGVGGHQGGHGAAGAGMGSILGADGSSSDRDASVSGGSAGEANAEGGMAGAGASSATAGMGAAGAGAQVAGAGAGAGAGSGGSDSSSVTPYPPLEADTIGTPMQIASGFALAESPLWDPCDNRLLFSDVSASGGGVINALGADGKVSQFMKATGNTNGIAWDVDGSLILAQMAGHVARRDRSGMVTTIDAPGTMLNTPDDVVVRSDGTIYLSDGDFCPVGSLLGYTRALPVYTIKPGTTMLINSGTVRGPNGIELSPDEKTLYVNGYGEGNIWRFDVMQDGSLMKQAQPFVTGLTDPDSMCLDAAGNLYVAVSAGIQVIRPDGTKLKLISVRGPAGSCTKAGATNCTFGGEDGKTLYITTWTTLWKIDGMPIPGLDWLVGKQRAQCN
jgi:gluconolactonase